MNKHLKAYLSRINFALNRNPHIEKQKDWQRFIPEPFKAVVIVSSDFELAWAWRYTKSSINPLKKAIDKAQIERKNVPKILTLCEQFNIPITWLTVGHLFLDSCSKTNGIPHPEIPRMQHFENDWWNFTGFDWFEYDPCSNYKDAPEWYCPDLIDLILKSKVNHEIGCHTFSHIDCSNEICPPELFLAEMEACQKAAEKLGIEKMESFVHPGYTIGNLEMLAEMGFTNFRTNYTNVLGYPQKHKNGLWEFKQTAEFVYRKKWSIDYHIFRYIEIVKRAIKNNSLCYYWFHPSFDPVVVEKILSEVFKFINENRNKIWVTTHNEYIDKISNEN